MAASLKEHQRNLRKEALREWLSQQKLIEKVFDIAQQIQELEPDEHSEFHLKKLRAAAEINLKLTNKYIPDLKQAEIAVEHSSRSAGELTREQLEAIASGATASGSGQGADKPAGVH